MIINETSLPGVFLIEPKKFGDNRGFFLETFRSSVFEEAGIPTKFVQDNHSRSSKGVLRGLHYQLFQPQGKLVRVATGSVYDVAVDVRNGSPTYGQWFGAELNEDNMQMMYVPPGFAHGFVVLSEIADFIYKCTNYYHPGSEQGIAWDDSDIGIDWPVKDVMLSAKDLQNPQLKDQAFDLLPLYEDINAS